MPTALVTGATAGIGAAFARQLAAAGHDLVLVARDKDRLAETARALPGVQVEILPADLTTDEGCADVSARLGATPVDLLVNNAGIGLNRPFATNALADEERLLRLNVLAVMRLTHAALPPMVARGSGAVLNVSSVSAFAPTSPGHTYPASKAWVNSFSESLAYALERKGVRVMALCPGFVRTEFHDRAGIDMSAVRKGLWLDADDVVRAALADLRRGKAVSTPSLQYKVLGALCRHAPRPLFRRLIGGFAKRAGRRPE
jgi:short-subunit dehydrogenase